MKAECFVPINVGCTAESCGAGKKFKVCLSNSLRVQSNVDTEDKFETFQSNVYLTENNHDFRVRVFPPSSSLDGVPAKHGEFFTCGKVAYIPSLII